MKLGRVIGTVVAGKKLDSFTGEKFLILQPLDENLEPDGEPLVANDTQQSGPGQLVTYIGGREATIPLGEPFNPSDAAVTGIVDEVETP